MESPYDGFVSRHLNRRLSRPLARVLSFTPVTPNQVSVASLGVALAAFFSFAYSQHIIAALLTQASSIIDGIDGDLARRKKMTSAFGGFMDSILDRYSDALIVLGLAVWVAGDGAQARVWITAFWALTGTFAVTYTRARIENTPRNVFDTGITSVASRDVRLFLVMVGALAGQGYATLLVLAILTNFVVLLRLLRARRALQGL
jgi:CDP-L-myo-inositol myo-inositolphosphotransferase